MEEMNNEQQVVTEQEKQWAMFLHLSSFLGFITGIGFFAPILLWLLKKDSEFIDENGKEATNFIISMVIYSFVAVFLSLLLIGFLLIPVLALLHIIATIMVAMKAKDGEIKKYPLTIRFIK